ncbi:hypothetical protein N8873_05835 [Flavobacteriaceae bacterium]|jgi:hypothetical protein|nr:hypothetical protein [Flavobacteriaceae bacterium]MDA7711565.1 hypothetical protein [Flavobacteriaceae bacterium]
MKQFSLIVFFGVSLAFGQKGEQERSSLIIPPKQRVQLDYPLLKGYEVHLWNTSKFELAVSTRNKLYDTLIKSISIQPKRTDKIFVEEGSFLQLENRFLSTAKVEFTIRQGTGAKKQTAKKLTPQRAFYLENNTAQTLPLQIPGVMNSKLPPFSRSGVDLPNGQKIYLDINGNKILLLTVTDSIQQGARIDLADLIDKALNQE